MISKLVDHGYIFSTIILTVYSQLVMRWQVAGAGPLPSDTSGKFQFLVELLSNPWVATGVLATFGAGISWMLAMTRFEVSYAFPFVSLNYVLVLMASVLLFHESISISKVLGSLLIIFGIIVIARG